MSLSQFRSGQVFARYRIESLLGEGGMGQVYRAYDTLLGRPIALKVVRAGEASGSAGARAGQKILREARAAAALSHRNAVSIFDVGEVDGVPFIAMELIEGRTLRNYVAGASAPIDRKLRWLADVALVLEGAHAVGLIHRDVKPENVMVCLDGSIKVLDFGIARWIEPDEPCRAAEIKQSASFLTTEGTIRGTPRYMAPEQLAGGSVDARADQYAWGLMAYELLAGVHPGGRLGALIGKPRPLNELAPSVHAGVAAVVAKALDPLPERRYRAMQEIVAALEPFILPAEAVMAPSPTPVSSPSGLADLSRTVTVPSVERRPTSATSTAATTPPRVRALRFLAIPFVIVAAIATVRVGIRRSRPPIVAASTPAPASTAITSLPLPASASREALAAYADGLQAIRDGAGHTARIKLEEAIRLDPMLAAAHLRVTLFLAEDDEQLARASFQRARELRALLTERDQAFLDALEPTVARTHADPAEAARRFAALSQRYPGDAEIAYQLAAVRRLEEGDNEGAAASLRHALALDPGFLQALAVLGEEQAYRGDFEGALATLGRCIEQSNAATQCAIARDRIRSQRGECEGLVETEEPDASDPRIAARSALRRAVVVGDFVGAEAAVRQIEDAAQGDRSLRWHMFAASNLVDIHAESGRPARAVEIARATLSTMHGWDPELRVDDAGIAHDRTPRLLAAAHLSERELIEKRAAWIDAWTPKAPRFAPYVWLEAYGETVETAESARAALDALPSFHGIPVFRPETAVSIGRVYWLAGAVDEALPHLEAEARACTAARWPFEHVRASYFLGRAREAKGDVAGACAAYEAVVTRWGHARPRSVTAEDAQQHARSLGCSSNASD